MKIYVASSWRNAYQPLVVQFLAGQFDVYDFRNPAPGNTGFQWSQIDPNWARWNVEQYSEALEHPIAIEGFKFDMEALNAADVVVLVLPCGRSAHTEAGYLAGKGKPVLVYVPEAETEPELMYKMFHSIHWTPSVLVDALRHLDSKERAKEATP